MRTLPSLPTVAAILAMTVPAVGCKPAVATDLPPLPDGCPGFQVLEPRLKASGGYVTRPEDFRDNARIDYAAIPANEAALAAAVARAEAGHRLMREVTYLQSAPWDVRVFEWGRDGSWGSFVANRTPDGAWAIENIRGQEVREGDEVKPPITGKVVKGSLGTTKANRMNAIIKDACLLREPAYYDGGAPSGPGCARGRDTLIEAKIDGKTYAFYQGCRPHGLSGETAMILRSIRSGQRRSVR